MTTETGSISDGFHTFDELYDHRTALFAALCRSNRHLAWRSRRHHQGGDPMYPGYFIAGIGVTPGTQITYHVRDTAWDLFYGVPERDHAPTWDGHTPADVVARLNGWKGVDR